MEPILKAGKVVFAGELNGLELKLGFVAISVGVVELAEPPIDAA